MLQNLNIYTETINSAQKRKHTI